MVTYTLDQIRQEVMALRDAATYTLEMLAGAAAKESGAAVEVTKSEETIGEWPQCPIPPCKIGDKTLERTGAVLRVHADNCETLLVALQGTGAARNADYLPTKVPTSIDKLDTLQMAAEGSGS